MGGGFFYCCIFNLIYLDLKGEVLEVLMNLRKIFYKGGQDFESREVDNVK